MKFTIFGSSGFIGSHLAEYVQKQNYECFLPQRNYELSNSQHLGHVIYCIGLTADFREKPFDTIEAHICKLKNILQNSQFDSFTYLSSTRMYIHNIGNVNENSLIPVSIIDPSDLFNSSKLTGELLALNCGKKNIKIARISNVYGNDFTSTNFITSIITDALTKGRITLRTTPDSAKDYIGINDLVRILFKISLEGKESVYNVATGLNIRNDEILKIIQNETSCELEYAPTAEKIIFPVIQIDKIKKEFGFSPSTNLLSDINRIIKQFKENNIKSNQ